MKIEQLIAELRKTPMTAEVAIETRGIEGTLHSRIGGDYDDENVAVLYGVAEGGSAFIVQDLIRHLKMGTPKNEAVIESAENEYTADFEVCYINSIVFLREKTDSKPW